MSLVEKRLLQAAVALAGCVPVAAGASGVFGDAPGASFGGEGHARYLSGLLLGIGLVFWWTIPSLERRGEIIRALTFIVFVGGLARLAHALQAGDWPPEAIFPLTMELAVTPALALWRERVARMSAK